MTDPTEHAGQRLLLDAAQAGDDFGGEGDSQ